MQLTVITPTDMAFSGPVDKVIAESEAGSFGLLPRHIDFVTTLVSGLLSFVDRDGEERVMAIEEGVLTKRGDRVSVAVIDATRPRRLGAVSGTLEQQFAQLDERGRQRRGVLARLEAGVVRRFLDSTRE